MARREALRVEDNGGIYNHIPWQEPEDWTAVRKDAELIQIIEPLSGWGRYRWAVEVGYRFAGDQDLTSSTYFVTGRQEPRERNASMYGRF